MDKFLSDKAEDRIRKSQSIFKGRMVTIEHVPINLGAYDGMNWSLFMITYKVSEWKKGDRKPIARVLRSVWCGGECLVQPILDSWMEDIEANRGAEEQLYLTEHIDDALAKAVSASLPGTMDGEIPICPNWNIVQPIDRQYPQRHRSDYRDFLYEIAVETVLEKLPTTPGAAPGPP